MIIGRQNIYLVGFSGTGKTKLGGIIAELLGRGFIDIDAQIVECERMPISDIFEKFGERHFRKVETELLFKAGWQRGLVVSTGGGAFCSIHNRDIMLSSGYVIWLDAPFALISTRLAKKTDRPLMRDPVKAEQLHRMRSTFWYPFAHVRVRISEEAPAAEIATHVLNVAGLQKAVT